MRLHVAQVVRRCIKCGLVATEGPLPYDWEVHAVKRVEVVGKTRREFWENILTCDDLCRAEMGLVRRKPKTEKQFASFDFD